VHHVVIPGGIEFDHADVHSAVWSRAGRPKSTASATGARRIRKT
jgi:hypothetical protein